MPADDKKKPAPAGPDRKAVEALQKVVAQSRAASKPKDDEDPGPEPISNIHSVSDAYRVGKDRLSRAFFGAPEKKK